VHSTTRLQVERREGAHQAAQMHLHSSLHPIIPCGPLLSSSNDEDAPSAKKKREKSLSSLRLLGAFSSLHVRLLVLDGLQIATVPSQPQLARMGSAG